MKITIKDKDIELKYTLRAMMMYENVTGNSLNPQNLTDIITFFYCVVLSSSKDYSLTFDEFLDYIDENTNVLNQFGEWLQEVVDTTNNLKKN